MADQPLRAYIVALTFGGGGPLFVNALVAPSPEAATALFSVTIMQEHAVQGPLAGVGAIELQPDFMRAALRSIEGKLPPDGNAQVLSLVPQVTQTIVDDPHAPAPEDAREQVYPGPQDDPPPAA